MLFLATLFTQLIHLGCQLLVFIEQWFNLVKPPLMVLHYLHDILQSDHIIILTQASQYWSKSVQNSTLPGLRL
jgi:hypothetical protein